RAFVTLPEMNPACRAPQATSARALSPRFTTATTVPSPRRYPSKAPSIAGGMIRSRRSVCHAYRVGRTNKAGPGSAPNPGRTEMPLQSWGALAAGVAFGWAGRSVSGSTREALIRAIVAAHKLRADMRRALGERAEWIEDLIAEGRLRYESEEPPPAYDEEEP